MHRARCARRHRGDRSRGIVQVWPRQGMGMGVRAVKAGMMNGVWITFELTA